MNIFVTSPCPIQSAKFLDSKRVVKMCLETAQLLSAAIILNGGKATYKLSHKNHPATIFTAKNKANYRWVLRHFCALSREYTRRYGRKHKSSELIKEFVDGIKRLPDGEQTPFPNCAANQSKGISYKHIDDVNLAYQLYLSDRWDTDVREPKWS